MESAAMSLACAGGTEAGAGMGRQMPLGDAIATDVAVADRARIHTRKRLIDVAAQLCPLLGQAVLLGHGNH